MPLTPQQIKDLMPFKAEEYPIGGYFYIKQDDGTFQMDNISQWEWDLRVKNKPWTIEQIRFELKELEKKGKLWRRINKAWQSFAYDNWKPQK